MRRLVTAAAVLMLWSLSVGASPIESPLGSAPEVDGVFEPEEWSGARTVEFTAAHGVVQIRAHLVHDSEQLYVAFESTANPDGELEGAVFPEALTRDYLLPAVGTAP